MFIHHASRDTKIMYTRPCTNTYILASRIYVPDFIMNTTLKLDTNCIRAVSYGSYDELITVSHIEPWRLYIPRRKSRWSNRYPQCT